MTNRVHRQWKLGSALRSLVCMGLLSALTAFCAETMPSRFLLIVDTSSPMQKCSEATLQLVSDLLNSGMNGEIEEGCQLGVWTFNEDLSTGELPLQEWSEGSQKTITGRTLAFLKAQEYANETRFEKVLPVMQDVIQESRQLTIILIGDGDEQMAGTPFDEEIREYYWRHSEKMQKAHVPIVTVLRSQMGELVGHHLTYPPWRVEFPPFPPEPEAPAEMTKPKAKPRIGEPLIVVGDRKKPTESTEVTEISQTTRLEPPERPSPPLEPDPSPATRPESTPVEPGEPIPAPSVGSGERPDAPLPVLPEVPSEDSLATITAVRQPSPEPAHDDAPLIAVVETADLDADPQATSASRASNAVSRTGPIATAVPGQTESSARHLGVVAALVLLVVALVGAFILSRRSQRHPSTSLITRSMDSEDPDPR